MPGIVPIPASPIFGTVPIGTIITWAGNIPSTPPPTTPPFFNPEDYGWLVCDGRTLNCGQYYNLYTVLGNVYGGTAPAQGSSDGTFVIPDFRGYFLRGADPTQVVDKDPRNPPTGDSSSVVGTTQLSAIQTHTHPYTMPDNKIPTVGPAQGTQTLGADPNQPTGPPDVPDQASANPDLVSQNETRPVNIAVYFLIKAL